MTIALKPIVGDWIIFDDTGRYPVQRVVRVTEKKVMTRERSYGERHHLASKVLFAGTEAACHRIAARLTSSLGQSIDESRKVRERHAARVEKILQQGDRTSLPQGEVYGEDFL